MSPDRLFKSGFRELILKTPQVFKIACLTTIRNLFPSGFDQGPYHVGFGNRPTDAESYKPNGIPMERIFIINTKSEIVNMDGDRT